MARRTVALPLANPSWTTHDFVRLQLDVDSDELAEWQEAAAREEQPTALWIVVACRQALNASEPSDGVSVDAMSAALAKLQKRPTTRAKPRPRRRGKKS
jgi:hypothetical protein